MKTAEQAMEFEEMKLSKPSKLSVRLAARKGQELNINRMSSWQILLYLTAKHRLGLISFYAGLVTLALIVAL